MLLELAEQFGVAPNRMLMIGDTTHDLMMAAAARTEAVGVTFGAHPRDQLAALQPMALVDSIDELRRWLLPD
jgi:phosphoglycolate phosphatase